MDKKSVLHEQVASFEVFHKRVRWEGERCRVLVKTRPGLAPGEELCLVMGVRHPRRHFTWSGCVHSRERTATGAWLVIEVDPTAAAAIAALGAPHAGTARRFGGRHDTSLWCLCRHPRAASSRAARVLDLGPSGLFLATGLEAQLGEAVFFKSPSSTQWLVGEVQWRGEKAGEQGLGLQVVFSRSQERMAWEAWYTASAAAGRA